MLPFTDGLKIITVTLCAKHFYSVFQCHYTRYTALRHSSFSTSSILKHVFKESSLMHSLFRIWHTILWDFHVSGTTQTKLEFLFFILRSD